MINYNHYGQRDNITNNGTTQTKCHRCQREQNWEHIISREGGTEIKEKYVNKMTDAIKKNKKLGTSKK